MKSPNVGLLNIVVLLLCHDNHMPNTSAEDARYYYKVDNLAQSSCTEHLKLVCSFACKLLFTTSRSKDYKTLKTTIGILWNHCRQNVHAISISISDAISNSLQGLTKSNQ